MKFCTYLGDEFKQKVADLVANNITTICTNSSEFVSTIMTLITDTVRTKVEETVLTPMRQSRFTPSVARIATEKALNMVLTLLNNPVTRTTVSTPIVIAMSTAPALAACSAGNNDTVKAIVLTAINTGIDTLCKSPQMNVAVETAAVPSNVAPVQPSVRRRKTMRKSRRTRRNRR